MDKTFVFNLKSDQGYGIALDVPAKSEEEARQKLKNLTSVEIPFDYLVNGNEILAGQLYLYPEELAKQEVYDEVEPEGE